MKNAFVMTRNVDLFVSLATSLSDRNRGVSGLGLVFGEPGLGKTKTGIWYADKVKAVFIRALATATVHSFLEDLIEELGETPKRRTADIYKQVEGVLMQKPRPIIIDEIDRLASSTKAIETIRDLADQTSAPILMIGMGDSAKKLANFKHLYYRMKAHIMQFKALTEADVAQFAEQICDVKLEDSAVAEIYNITQGSIGDVIAELHKIERIARANDLSAVTATQLKRQTA